MVFSFLHQPYAKALCALCPAWGAFKRKIPAAGPVLGFFQHGQGQRQHTPGKLVHQHGAQAQRAEARRKGQNDAQKGRQDDGRSLHQTGHVLALRRAHRPPRNEAHEPDWISTPSLSGR